MARFTNEKQLVACLHDNYGSVIVNGIPFAMSVHFQNAPALAGSLFTSPVSVVLTRIHSAFS
jgi:hypothetical protein